MFRRSSEPALVATPAILLLAVSISAVAGCGIPVVPFTLAPVPRAGDGAYPVKAQIRRAAVSHDLLAAGARPSPASRLAIEIDLHNADTQRTFDVGAPVVRVQDALGGPIMTAGMVLIRPHGLEPSYADDESAALPAGAPPPPAPGVLLRPGETRTVSAVYDRLPPTTAGPLRVTVTLTVSGEKPLELVLAAPVEGGVRWQHPQAMPSGLVGGGWTRLGGASRTHLLEPFSFGGRRSRGRLVLGFEYRLGFLYRETLAGGPPAFTQSASMGVGWHPWHFPLGVYADGGLLYGIESPPRAYQRTGNGSSRFLFLPRVAVGLALGSGHPLHGSALFPVDRPPSPLRRLTFRLGYARFFNTDDKFGTSGFEVRLESAL